jgi:DNA-binding XRE family transcriptional regulator
VAKGKYEEWLTAEGLLQLEAWARNGLTDEQIASNIGITRTTLYEWKKLYPDISDALKRGKEVVDIQVENALLKRALGYQFTEVTRERVYNESTQKHKFEITKKVVKEVQPDTTAQIFWLKNRKPAEWRDRKEIDANIRRNDPFEGLTREQLLKIAGEEDV